MAITYRWEILRLQVKPSAEGQQNVLHRIHWRLWGKLVDETGEYESSIEDSTTLRFNPNNGFVDFTDLVQNHNIIVNWIEDRENERQRNIAWRKQQIDKLVMEKKNPPMVDYLPNGSLVEIPQIPIN
jgi:hypothetical protein